MAPQHCEGDTDTRHNSHSSPAPLTIPDIQLPFAVAPPRADTERLRTHALAWAQRYGLIGRRGAHRLTTTDRKSVV